MIPTVRVANPVHKNEFMIINAADYRPAVHGPLWHVQAPDFAGIPAPPVANYAKDERDFAGALMLEVMEMNAQAKGTTFSGLSPEYRMVALRDARNEFEQARTEFQRSRQVSDGFTIERELPEGATLFEQAPTPVDDSIEARLATQNGDPGPNGTLRTTELVDPATGADPAPGLPPLGTEAPEGGGNPPSNPAQPETPAPAGTPSWASKPAVDPTAMRVEKGPGSKFYVMRAAEVLSEGFTTKAKAEDEMARLVKVEVEKPAE